MVSQAHRFRPIDSSFTIRTDLFHFDICETETPHFFCKGDIHHLTLYCPLGTKYDVGEFQIWFRKVIREVLRREAKAIFPSRLHQWSDRTHLTYKRLTIKCTSSKWGSYSSLGNLNLSLYLLLFDSRYIDYTMCHELCHSRELNHGPQFWQLLDSIMGNGSRQLQHEMNSQVKAWYEAGDPRYLLVSNA
ncbi:MAG: DUF45 domain-containing protein [Prevotellaceae bacterium]|jgi:predicted metal-dependent hydrolase|nr:DUF45 domain-containing protein [Prevotellaceae bacterium]MDY3856545.1 YgjP-like metallopeptidase domain-containing protein [Bacteroidaceae bacterium]